MTVPIYTCCPLLAPAPEPSRNVRPCLSAHFAASAAGGPSRGASEAGDHGGAQRRHRGARTARSPTHRVYTLNLSSPTSCVGI